MSRPTCSLRPAGLAAVVLSVISAPVAARGVTTVATTNALGDFGDRPSRLGSMSADGRFVAFDSEATNLLPTNDGTYTKVYVFDRVTRTLERQDVTAGGAPSGAFSAAPSISADGRFVAFTSASQVLGGFPSGANDVFVRDRTTGAIECLTSTATSTGGSSNSPVISADGRFVAFRALEATIPPGTFQIYVRDRTSGTTVLASADPQGGLADRSCDDIALSDDGRWVAFTSAAEDLVPGDVNAHVVDVYLRDLLLGVTTRASVSSGGQQAVEGATCVGISGDGRYVLFGSSGSNLLPGPIPYSAFVRDVVLGTTTIVSRTPAGALPSGNAYACSISTDGRFVLFSSAAPDYFAGDVPGTVDLFARDRLTDEMGRIDVSDVGVPGAYTAPVSDDGRVVAVEFEAFGDTQVAVHDRSASVARSYCAGTVNCPCANNGANGAGCENSFGTGGATLAAEGNASIGTDQLMLRATEMPPSTAALFLQGTSDLGGGSGVVFGDGLRCVGGSVIRLGVRGAVLGAAAYGGPLGDVPISVRGAVTAPGSVRYYQAWYRNNAPYCTASTFNLSNGVEIRWGW